MVGPISEHSPAVVAEDLSIHPLRTNQIESAVHLLAESYCEDPSVRSIVPQASRERLVQILIRYFGWLLEDGMRRGLVTVMERKRRLHGVVIYFPPTVKSQSFSRSLRSIWRMIVMSILLGIPAMTRLIRVARETNNARPKQPHYYIELGCVARGRKHKGVGRRLAQYIFRLAEREGVGVYAETFNPENLLIMRHLGYEITASHNSQAGNFWSLWREPRLLEG